MISLLKVAIVVYFIIKLRYFTHITNKTLTRVFVHFCSYSWGYKRVFEQYSQFLHRNFPQMSIVGDNYPPPLLRQYLAGIISFGKLAVIALILMGDRLQILESLNIQPPDIYSWAQQNKVRVVKYYWSRTGCFQQFHVICLLEKRLLVWLFCTSEYNRKGQTDVQMVLVLFGV